MRQLVTLAIILRRVDYGEADRILTLLTPEFGKLRLLAKGVRRVKSKLAGGIELFSVSEITFIRGRGEIGTLVSARLQLHYPRIVTDLDRTFLGYELIKKLHRATEEETEKDYFTLLQQAFQALNDLDVSRELVSLWFLMQLLRLGGYAPNLDTDTQGEKLKPGTAYRFDLDRVAFAPEPQGSFTADHIKLLRLGFNGCSPFALQRIQGIEELAQETQTIIDGLMAVHIRS